MARVGRLTGSRNLILTFDAFDTLFTPREPVARQYLEVARSLGFPRVPEVDLQRSFRNGEWSRFDPCSTGKPLIMLVLLFSLQAGVQGVPQLWKN